MPSDQFGADRTPDSHSGPDCVSPSRNNNEGECLVDQEVPKRLEAKPALETLPKMVCAHMSDDELIDH